MTNASARRRGVLRAIHEVFAFTLQTNFDASELSGDRVLHPVQTRIGSDKNYLQELGQGSE